MKHIISIIIKKLAVRALNRHQPFIIAITGSYGKTSTKDALAMALVDLLPKNSVRFPEKSFNNEIGVPLSILGLPSPGRSFFGWISVLVKGYFATIPPVLVLELGADHKGEISGWSSLIEPHISIITGVSPVHLEHYASYDELKMEKASIASYARKYVFLNADDAELMAMRSHMKKDSLVHAVGFDDQAEYKLSQESLLLRADDSYDPKEQLTTLHGSLSFEDQSYRFTLRNGLSHAALQSCGMAFCAISALQQLPQYPYPVRSAEEIAQSISRTWKPTNGRLHPLPGIKGSLVIDDSYNAAPAAVRHGLGVLRAFPNPGRKISALGVMAELGPESESIHIRMADWILDSAHIFIGVGEEVLVTIEALKEKGFPVSSIHWFKNSKEAGRFLDREVQKGDVVYVKGSQSARMEWIVKDIMAEPMRANQLLVRQEKKWLK